MPELRLERSGTPTGLMRLLYRSPILLYRAWLGFLFGMRSSWSSTSGESLAIAEMAGPVDARSVIGEYATAHPRAFGRLAAFMFDDPGETSQIQARRVGEIVPIVRMSKTR